jgi:hypothetical protein
MNILHITDTLIVSGSQAMSIPSGGPHVRSASITIPHIFANNNDVAVTGTVYYRTSVGTMFSIYSIKILTQANSTVIDVEAQNIQIGQGVPDMFFWNYIVIGKLK